MTSRQNRLMKAEDLEDSLRIAVEAFGELPPGTPPINPADYPRPGRRAWGTFEDGRLVARIVAPAYHSWFRGVEVPTCGIAGVAVVAERRGAGLLTDLFRAVLADATEQGQVLSTLFPTAPGIYRRLGYELIGSYDTVDLPTAELTAVRAPDGVTTRRATAADVPAVRAAYATWAAGQNGPLTRTGPSFTKTDEDLIDAFTGITLAEDAEGRVVGYASWQRGTGYDADATIEVGDLIALTPDAARALWRVLGSFTSVTGRVRLPTSGADLARLVLPAGEWAVTRRHPYMLRVHDVAAALSALPLTGAADLAFAVAGDPVGTMDGGYRLRVADGRATCERAEAPDGAPVLTPQGIALAYAGTQSCANLRFAGHLHGGDATFDATLDALLGGRQVHIRDYF